MAEVTVRVRINQTFTVTCEGTTEDEAVNDIVDCSRLDQRFIDTCLDAMEVEEGTYDKPEDDEEEEE